MQTEMKFEKRKIASLLPAEYNPRIELEPDDPEYQKIKRSIETFGYVDPIIINADGTIIGGHQRYNILMDLGYTEVQVVVLDLNKDDEKALNIALNKINGDWDEIKLKDLLQDLTLGDYDISVTGFMQEDLDDMIDRIDIKPEIHDDEFDENEALSDIKNPVTKRGDIWILGRHRLMCGDSTDPDDVDKLMAGESADLVITDPPYNVNYEGKADFMEEYLDGKGTRETSRIMNDDMDDTSFYNFLFEAYKKAYDVMRPGAAIYVFHADSTGHIFRRAFIDAGLKLAQCLIWEKNTFTLGRQDYQWRHEPILYGWKEGAAHYFVEDRTKDTILYENKPLKNDMHPTMKPMALVGNLMENSSRSKWKVLDLFGGSGSTMMAAEQLNRHAYIMELDEKYCDVIIKRWEDYTGQKAVRENEAVKL